MPQTTDARAHAHALPAEPAPATLTPAPTLLEEGREESRRRERAWTRLFAALCLGAGNGLGLTTALSALYGLPNLRELGGPRTAALVLWFALCVPLAALAWAGRERLLRSRRLVLVANAASTVTLLAFALYLYKLLRG